MIPADCRVIESVDLFISESMLTGESLPVEKRPNPLKNAESIPLLELENLCFMGTNVVSGSAKAIVVNTGSDRKSTRLNSSHVAISYAVFCLKKKKETIHNKLK